MLVPKLVPVIVIIVLIVPLTGFNCVTVGVTAMS